jgi:hypothetical protein
VAARQPAPTASRAGSATRRCGAVPRASAPSCPLLRRRHIPACHPPPNEPRQLKDNRFWAFVMDNAPWSTYSAYKVTLYGLVDRALEQVHQVRRGGGAGRACLGGGATRWGPPAPPRTPCRCRRPLPTLGASRRRVSPWRLLPRVPPACRPSGQVGTIMEVLLAVEACLLFIGASVYVGHLMKHVRVGREGFEGRSRRGRKHVKGQAGQAGGEGEGRRGASRTALVGQSGRGRRRQGSQQQCRGVASPAVTQCHAPAGARRRRHPGDPPALQHVRRLPGAARRLSPCAVQQEGGGWGGAGQGLGLGLGASSRRGRGPGASTAVWAIARHWFEGRWPDCAPPRSPQPPSKPLSARSSWTRTTTATATMKTRRRRPRRARRRGRRRRSWSSRRSSGWVCGRGNRAGLRETRACRPLPLRVALTPGLPPQTTHPHRCS